MKPDNKKTIAVVDDSEIVLEVLRELLEGAGYRVLTRSRPVGCVAMMLQEEPDLVLIDVSMPGVGGDTLVRCFGTANPSSACVILLYSGLPENVLEKKVRSSGAHGYIRKSDDQNGLLREIAQWLGRSPGRPLGRPRTPSPFSAPKSEQAPSSVVSSGLRPLTVPKSALLVATDIAVLSGYSKDLQHDRLTFEFALSGAQALHRLSGETPPDLIVSHLDTGEVGGMDLYRHALEIDQKWQNRFVLIAESQDRARLQLPGMLFAGPVLYRPFEIRALQEVIDGCLGGRRAPLRSAL